MGRHDRGEACLAACKVPLASGPACFSLEVSPPACLLADYRACQTSVPKRSSKCACTLCGRGLQEVIIKHPVIVEGISAGDYLAADFCTFSQDTPSCRVQCQALHIRM